MSSDPESLSTSLEEAQANGSRRKRLVSRATALSLLFFEPVPSCIWGFAVSLASLGMLTANPALTAVAILVVPVAYGLLWRHGEPPALLFAFGIQWLQVVLPVFGADFEKLPLSTSMPVPRIETAAWLSLAGLVAFAVGARIALRGPLTSPTQNAESQAMALSAARLFALWTCLFGLSAVISAVMFNFPGFTQVLGAARCLKWLVVFLLAYSVLLRRRGYAWFTIVIVFEVLYGFTQYFSGYRAVFSMVIVVLLTGRSLSKQRLISLTTAALVLILLTLFWTSIKPQYREFLNEGSRQQVTTAPVSQRFEKLWQMLGEVGRGDIDTAAQHLARRIGYLEFFAHAIDCVPVAVPHQNGKLWGEALTRPLMPRLFFPNKPAVHDSLRTREYTGINVAGPDEGASIGIGYMGESYIDFGKVWMFGPILLWGFACGLIYRFLVFGLGDKAFGFAAATAIIIFGASQVETSNIKLIGGNLVTLIVVLGVYLTVWPLIRKFLIDESTGQKRLNGRRARRPSGKLPQAAERVSQGSA